MKTLIREFMETLRGRTFQLYTTKSGVKDKRDYTFNFTLHYIGKPTENVFTNFDPDVPVIFIDGHVVSGIPVIGTAKPNMRCQLRIVAHKNRGMMQCAMFERIMREFLLETGLYVKEIVTQVGMPFSVDFGSIETLKHKQTDEIVNEYLSQDVVFTVSLHHSREV